MNTTTPFHQPASWRASYFLDLLKWLGISALALTAAAVIVF
ncbi:hypothetical protein [Comamonas sp. UBA7528]|nr:hypothetical protein [Comamonas sp. UBA7528]